MIAIWMVYAAFVTALLGIVGVLVERIASIARWPRRVGWAVVALLAVTFAAAVAWPRSPVAVPATAAQVKDGPVSRERTQAVAIGSRDEIPVSMIDRIRALPARMAPQLARWDSPLLLLWGAGSALMTAVCLAGAWLLGRRRRGWVQHHADGVRVLLTIDDGPAVVGTLRSEIVLPRWALALDGPSRSLLIQHEREHIRARDPLLMHASAVAVMLMPWNAALWWIHRRLRLAIELDCDARVLASGADRAVDDARYGELLLTVATRRSRHFFQVVPAFLEHTSSLSRRITSMYAQPLRFGRLQSICAASAAALLLAAAVLLPAPELRAQEPGSASVVRLVGSPSSSPAPVMSRAATRELLARYFPDVLRGEGPESVVFVRDAAGRVIGTMPPPAALRIIEFLQREGGSSLREESAAGQLESHRLELRTSEPGNEPRELTARQQEERQQQERQQQERRQQEHRRAGELADTTRERMERQQAERQTMENRIRDGRVVVRTGPDSDRGRAGLSPSNTMIMYRPGYALDAELTAEQRHTAERVVSADKVQHRAGDVGPQAVRVVFLTLRGGN
jgi:beta-lactamase regulating signal transducer with metallopeptidase domain